jgi:hypothetical protein
VCWVIGRWLKYRPAKMRLLKSQRGFGVSKSLLYQDTSSDPYYNGKFDRLVQRNSTLKEADREIRHFLA